MIISDVFLSSIKLVKKHDADNILVFALHCISFNNNNGDNNDYITLNYITLELVNVAQVQDWTSKQLYAL